jgi:hypothetical protein
MYFVLMCANKTMKPAEIFPKREEEGRRRRMKEWVNLIEIHYKHHNGIPCTTNVC